MTDLPMAFSFFWFWLVKLVLLCFVLFITTPTPLALKQPPLFFSSLLGEDSTQSLQ